MTETQKEIAIKIISFLKTRGLVNRQDIADFVEISPFKNNLSTAIESLKEDGFISEPKHYVYKITSSGMNFESFEKTEEEKQLQIILAKSNIEANELQKIIAKQNAKKERRIEVATWINVVVGIINLAVIIWQLTKAAQ